MSDNTASEGGKATLWTEEAKFQFLLRVVAQLKENGATVNWSRINMPGRTTKSLQNMWTKINKMVAEMEAASGSAPNTPTTKGTSRKAGSAKKAIVNDFDDIPLTPTPKKRAAGATPGRSAKKVKTEDVELVVKNESDDLDDDDD